MSAKTDVMELHELKIEIKRVAGELKKLRTAEKEIENRLTNILVKLTSQVSSMEPPP